jgi:hypothetical protein
MHATESARRSWQLRDLRRRRRALPRFGFPIFAGDLFAIPVLVIVGAMKRRPDLRNRYNLSGALFVASLGCLIIHQQKF